jgi:serine/threonine-protein kinase RsbW
MQSQTEPTITRSGEEACLAPGGDIIAASVTEMRALMKGLLEEGVHQLVVDLSDVKVIDSSGIGMLVAAHNSLSRQGGKLSVIHASEELLDLLKAFRLDRHFSISGES